MMVNNLGLKLSMRDCQIFASGAADWAMTYKNASLVREMSWVM